MKTREAAYTLAITAASLFALSSLESCYKNPVTGRSSVNLVDEGTLSSLSNTEYSTFMTQNKPMSGAQADMVKRVGNKLAAAITQYYNSKGQGNALAGYQWEFNLVNSPDINAWCMPGGKVVIYTGILPVTRDEAGLAVVMGHEIAHAIARHGNERMSQGLIQQAGGTALSVALASKPAQTQELFKTAYGVGSQVGVLLPFSRKQESEADEMGLIFMALAGYNPSVAVDFWQRMSAASGSGNKPPELLSTHPSDATRISKIQKQIPSAMAYYKP